MYIDFNMSKMSSDNFSYNMDRRRCSSLPLELNTPTSSRISRRTNSASELLSVDEQNEEGTGYASADDDQDQSIYSSACSGSQTINSAALQSSMDEMIDNSEINQ
jgi:hypothetical protein